MKEDLRTIVNDISNDEASKFISKTKSTLAVKKTNEKITVDLSWVDTIFESIPFLDNIIRNPRRFITQEEDIVPIEKTKKVTEESIKHLAQHTSLIQEVDEDGTIKPIKLLNIYKEETIDLYENRFIFSLISNLYVFLQNQLVYKDEESSTKEVRTVNYVAQTKHNDEDITVSLALKTTKSEILQGKGKTEEVKAKIEQIRDVLDDFRSSQFMKTMLNATPVRSPIRKTNVILKDQNFICALKLWEFLENYQIKAPVTKTKNETDLTSEQVDKDYSLAYFMNYNILNNITKKIAGNPQEKYAELKKIVFDTAKSFDINENELKRIIINELKLAAKYKQEQFKNINEAYKTFVNNHFKMLENALLMLK